MVVVRIPPSPTGHLHLGTARTALFNYLFAKKETGEIVFRWEDTDQERSKPEYEREILDGLSWLGMDFEKESSLFCRQTEATEDHQAALKKLWEAGKIFPCFLSTEEIQAARTKADQEKKPFVFWSPFRDQPRAELEEKMKTAPFVWRLRGEKDRTVTFLDLVRGDVSVNTSTLGDFVVARQDGSVLYLLANVIDDANQNITHIIKGDDHISNTPKQLLLWEALEKTPPAYAHIPLVLDTAGRKLSKRNVEPDVCVLISDFKKQGFLPEAVLNGLAFLGWNPKTTQEIFSKEELIEAFDLKKINAAGSKYDYEKMKWFNAQWIKKIPLPALVQRVNDFLGTSYNENAHAKAFALAREKAKTLEDFREECAYLIEDPGIEKAKLGQEKWGLTVERAQEMLSSAKKMLEETSTTPLSAEEVKELSTQKISELAVKNGEFLWPFRVALSNRERSAPPFEMVEVLGKEESLRRLSRAIQA